MAAMAQILLQTSVIFARAFSVKVCQVFRCHREKRIGNRQLLVFVSYLGPGFFDLLLN